MQKIISLSVFLAFLVNVSGLSPVAYAQLASPANGEFTLPKIGAMVQRTASFKPVMIKGIFIHQEDPLMFDFIVDAGDTKMTGEALKDESTKLIKYFLASLTVPENDVWVNLSPYEKDRIVPQQFGVTEMGRDLLAQDYVLKQLTASLMFPESVLGKEFWKKIYQKAYQLYGTSNIPVNTFNKVWIVPDKAVVCENGNGAFIARSRLKVMLEEDYLALAKNSHIKTRSDGAHKAASEIIREIILPAIEKEVNEGKVFANLRQIYNAQIMAAWYRTAISQSFLNQVYAGKNKVKGVDIKDKDTKNRIYDQYLKAFKRGVYNFVKEDWDPAFHQTVPRKYFAGEYDGRRIKSVMDRASLAEFGPKQTKALINDLGTDVFRMVVHFRGIDAAMAAPRAPAEGKGILPSSEVTDAMLPIVGVKATALAGFERYMRGQGKPINGAAWFVWPNTFAPYYGHGRQNFMIERRSEFDLALEQLAGDSGLRFGGPQQPLLVSVRASSKEVREGYYVTVLDVGINDDNLKGLAQELGSDSIAYEMYAKLIHELAVISGGVNEKAFQDRVALLKERKAKITPEGAVAIHKEVYRELVGREFPQDVYEQLRLAITGAATLRRADAKKTGDINGVMVERMRFGNLKGSFSGSIISRNPDTGEKEFVGTASKEKQGDDVNESEGLEELSKRYPKLLDELKAIVADAEKYLRDIAVIEFTIERLPGQAPTLYILQVRQSFSSKEARVKTLVDFVDERIKTKEEVSRMLQKIDLQELKYDPISRFPNWNDTEWIGKADFIASRGIASGVVVSTLKQAAKLRQQGIPVIAVLPVVTAIDEDLIKASNGVVAMEHFGWHVQGISVKYNVPAILGLPNSSFDPKTGQKFVNVNGEKYELKDGKTVLMIGQNGYVYLRDIQAADLANEQNKRRKKYLPDYLIKALAWQIEAGGKSPEYVKRGDQIVDVVPSGSSVAEQKKVARHLISEGQLHAIVRHVLAEKDKDIEFFTYAFWRAYDYFPNIDRSVEGPLEYENLEEMRGLYVREIVKAAEPEFVQLVFYGVDRHKMSQYIFRSTIIDSMDRDFAEELFVKVVAYGVKHGYSGYLDALDWQTARLYSHFIATGKKGIDFARQVISRFNKPQRMFLLNELKQFYITHQMHAKAHDEGFASSDKLLGVLELAGKDTPEFFNESKDLRKQLADQALITAQSPLQKGGIDLSLDMMELQIRRGPNGMPLPLKDQPSSIRDIDGLVPVVLHMIQVNPVEIVKEGM